MNSFAASFVNDCGHLLVRLRSALFFNQAATWFNGLAGAISLLDVWALDSWWWVFAALFQISMVLVLWLQARPLRRRAQQLRALRSAVMRADASRNRHEFNLHFEQVEAHIHNLP